MIYPGTDLKFKVSAVGRGMSLADCGFAIVVRNGYGRVVFVADKQDLLTDSAGGFYFMMKSVAAGEYTSTITIEKPDINFDGAKQHIVDKSPLCSVNSHGVWMSKQATDGLAVCYERVWTVNIGEGVYLCDVNGNPILDSEGQPIMLSDQGSESESVKLDITAAELSRLLTSRDKNGKIDTIPEVMDAIGGLGDDTEMSVMTDEDTDEMMDRVLNKDQEYDVMTDDDVDDMMGRILGNGDTAGGH